MLVCATLCRKLLQGAVGLKMSCWGNWDTFITLKSHVLFFYMRSTFENIFVNGMSLSSSTRNTSLRSNAFENMILKWLFGTKKDENGEWRSLHSGEIHSLYCLFNIVRVIKSRRLRGAGHVARLEDGSSDLKILTGKSRGKRPLGRPRRRWEDNIRMDLEEIGINAGN